MFSTGTKANRRRGIVAATVALLLVGIGALAIALVRQEPAPPERPSSISATSSRPDPDRTGTPAAPDADREERRAQRPPTSSAQPPKPSTVRGPALDSSPPVAVTIPDLGISSSLLELGLNDDNTMEVPSDPASVGWFTKAPTPGSLGPAVLAGHVTWDQRPAVFFELANLRRDDTVEVTRRDGKTIVFTITEVEQYAKAEFPTDKVYGVIDHPGLRLITCAGDLDRDTGDYNDNIVVYAELTDVR